MPNTTEPVTDGTLASGFYFVVDSGFGYPRIGFPNLRPQSGLPGSSVLGTLYVDPTPIVTLGHFTRIFSDDAINGGREVRIDMDEIGAARWLIGSRQSIGKQVAIVIDDSVYSAPVVQSEIAGGRASIHLGDAGDAEVEESVQRLNAERQGATLAR